MQYQPFSLKQLALLFSLAMVLSLTGLSLRSFESLSIFWPGNALLVGLLIRFPRLDHPVTLLIMFCGMLTVDLLWGTPLLISVGLNIANMAFVACARWVLLTDRFTGAQPRRLQALVRVFPASMIGAAACAVLGAIVSERYFHDELFKALFSWFSEQLSTSLLLLPLVISLPRRDELKEMKKVRQESSLLPVVTLVITTVAGIWVGGGASLLFPLPALLWCAISYPLFVTCCLTFITGISEIILVASNVLNIQGKDDLFRIDSLSSARVGVAAMLIGPLIVALSTTANKKLVARVTQRADFDLLTGALTRSGLSSRLETLMKPRGKTRNFTGAAFLVDIDRFKNINDTWGHASGDHVLARTAECIRQSLQPSAIICRMGGEEFLVLIEGINPARAFLLANRLRHRIENNEILLNGNNLSVTVSIGLSALDIDHVQSLDAAIDQADQQLYIAKHSGRNQVRPEFVL
ncbi:GGDEF domain-containing protein [Erwinia sp. Leaf53]|uniref:GGDEF domain-containing protein n=1 Tax=Erwinia sp. Leaf53 TaxID=1736225 RepID=UPI0006FDC6F3|nr:GGDEF domain-containing protein [Erwinia sp. Leaf53]KQN56621.1 histidine kinase [Erwinia sp. Leaf53]